MGDLPKTLKEWQARRRKTHRNLVPAAAAHLMVRANMNIITRAAMDDDTIYGRFLTLQRDFHNIMAGGNGKNGPGNGHGAPFPSCFVPQDPAPAAPAPAREPAGHAPLIVDGTENVAGSV